MDGGIQFPLITIAAGASGTGKGNRDIQRGPESDGSAGEDRHNRRERSGTFSVNQAAGPPCVYTLTGNIQWFTAAGAPWSFLVERDGLFMDSHPQCSMDHYYEFAERFRKRSRDF